jgi:divalent metal cation (Fe/Co/Zn/Cd) transporter
MLDRITARIMTQPLRDDRIALLGRALWLSALSVGVGVASGALSVTAGVTAHTLGVFGSGLGVLADVAGSAVLVWRFHGERRSPHRAERLERRAALVVASALALLSAAVAAQAVLALINATHPGTSVLGLLAAAVACVVLPPLAVAKRRTAAALVSHALRGDSTATAIGAATALLALIGLLLFRAFDWWWADRLVALLVAAIAAAESYSVSRHTRQA